MNAKKTLALLIFKYFPYGGLQRDFLEVAKNILKRDVDIKILTGSWEGPIPEGMEVKELKVRGFSNHSKNKEFYKQAKKELEKIKPDLVFGFNKMPELDIYLAADTCFKFFSKSKNPLYKFTPRYKAFIDYERKVFGIDTRTKSLLLNKKQEEEYSLEYKTDKSRLTIIPPGLSQTWKKEAEGASIKKELNINDSDLLLLFVGSSFQRKGLDRAIKAIAYNQKSEKQNVYLAVIGKDDHNPYLRLAKNLKVDKNVYFLGPRDDVPKIMASSDLLIHPAREEAAGNVIIEAMISELPVLTCEEVGFSSYVKDYDAGLITSNPFSQEELNNFVLKMSDELHLYRNNLVGLRNNDLFFSRFDFIGDFIQKELYG